MATQGIVSVMEDGRTLFKVVAGCNGMRAPYLAKAIKKQPNLTIDKLHTLAIDNAFGCGSCLVVVSEEDVIYGGDDELNQRYFTTFLDPKFNPRWDLGTASYVEIVDYHSSKPSTKTEVS
jgi:hypothetical protein